MVPMGVYDRWMRHRVLLVLAFAMQPACSLLTDLDGFVATRAVDSASDGGTTPEAGPAVTAKDADIVNESGPGPGPAPVDGGDASPPVEGCSELLLVGNKTLDGSKGDGLPQGVIDAYGYEVTQAGRATCAWVYLDDFTGAVALGIYTHDENQGHPKDLVARAVVETPKIGWNSAKLEKAFDVQKPAIYWIGISPLVGSADNRAHDGPCAGRNLHAGGAPSNGTPNPFNAGSDNVGFCEALMYLAP